LLSVDIDGRGIDEPGLALEIADATVFEVAFVDVVEA
jgi:hypothetical protein